MEKSNERVCFIYNATARRGRAAKKLEWLKKEASLRWNDFDILLTGNNGKVKGINDGEYDAIIACGGDGTIHNTVNQFIDAKVTIGLLPIGSGNDFAKAISLPKDEKKCLDILARGFTRKVDLIRCTGDADRWCVNTVGAGLDGLANVYTLRYKKYVGTAGYFFGALHASMRFRGTRMKVITDENRYDDHFLMITTCNGPIEGGSFIVAPKADVYDGYIDILKIRKTSIPKLLYYLPKFKKEFPEYMKGLSTDRCKKIKIETEDPISVHADGEHLGSEIKNLELSVHEQILEMIVPE